MSWYTFEIFVHWMTANYPGPEKGTTKPWCFFHHASWLGWEFGVQWRFEHFSQKVKLLYHLSTAHFPKRHCSDGLGQKWVILVHILVLFFHEHKYTITMAVCNFLEVLCCNPCFFYTSFRILWCILRVIFAGYPLLGREAIVQSFCWQGISTWIHAHPGH